MKTIFKPIRTMQKFVLMAILLLTAFTANAQMNGTVTIDNTSAASATNFQNWFSFYRSLQGLSRTDGGSTLTAGVSGPVTVNVITDVMESTGVQFPAITGMNPTNTITINGNGKSLIYTGTLEAISFTGGDYFTIKNLVISDTNNTTAVIGIRFSNNSDNNTIDGCTIEFTKSITAPTAATSAYIAFAPSATSLTATSTVTSGSFNTIKNCTMRTTKTNAPGPYIGIVIIGNSTLATQQTVATNNTIDNNIIGNFYFYGVYQTGSNGNQITNNDISRSNANLNSPTSATMYGINSTGNYCTSRSTTVNNNKIHDLPWSGATAVSTNPVTTMYGILLSTITGTSTNQVQISNNTIDKMYINGSSLFYGVNASSATFLTVNTNKISNIANWSTGGAIYGFYLVSGTSVTATYNTYTAINSQYYSYAFSTTSCTNSTFNYNTLNDIKTVQYSYGFLATSTKTSSFNYNTYRDVAISGAGYSYFVQSSSCSTVTFNNNLIDNVTTTSGYNYGIQSNTGTSLTISNNVFQNSSTSSSGYIYAFQLQNNASATVSSNSILGCTAFGTGYIYCFDMQVSTTGMNNNLISNNTIENCALKGTSTQYIYGYYLYASSTTYLPANWQVINNVLNNCYSTNASITTYVYAFYMYYQQDFVFQKNQVTNCKLAYVSGGYLYSFYIYGSSSSAVNKYNIFEDNVVSGNTCYYNYGFYLYYYNTSLTYNNWQVHRNKVVNNTVYYYMVGMYLYYPFNVVMTNNVIAGNKHLNTSTGYMYALYLYNGTNMGTGMKWEVRNNTWQYDATTAQTPGSIYMYFYLYAYYVDDFRFTGNIMDLKGGYYQYVYMYNYSTSGVAFSGVKEFDYNDWFIRNWSTPYWYVNGTNYADYYGAKQAGYTGPNDQYLDPEFRNKSTFDFHAKAFQLQNFVPYKSTVPKDFDGIARNTSFHDAGAFEQSAFDIQMVSTNFSLPDTVCSGYSLGNTSVIIKNKYAEDSASGFNVSYTINGGSKVSNVVTKKILPGDTAKIFYSKPVKLDVPGKNTVVMTIERNDDTMSNQSLTFVTFVKPAPGGGVLTPSVKPTKTIYQPIKTNDVTIVGQPVIFNVSAPRIYSNNVYGSKWKASVYAKTSNGTLRPSSESIVTVTPVGTTPLEVQYKTQDLNIEDSMITFVIKITDLTNGCDTLINRNILVYPTIVSKFTFPAKVCGGDAVLFENKSTVKSGTMEFAWNFGTGNPKDVAISPEPTFTFPSTGTYKVKLLMTTLPYGFPTQDSAMVVVNEVPIVQFTKKDACDGYNLTFTNNTTPANSTYLWKFGDNTTATTANATHKYTNTGVYNVSLVATLNGCSTTMTKRAYQFEVPKTSWSKVSGRCDNVPFQFANTSTITNGTFGSLWYFNDGTVSTDVSPIHLFETSGNLTVKLVNTSEFGCKDSVTKVINVQESPKVNFSNSNACSLTPTVFTNQTPAVTGTIASYAWNFGDGGTSTAANPTHPWGTLGPKTVTLKVNLDNLCFSTFSKTLTVGVQPKAEFSGNSVCAGEPVLFVNKTTWSQGDVSYEWNFGDGNLSTAQVPQKNYITTQTKTYNVQLKATIAGGCSDSVNHQITVNELPKACDFNANPDYAFSYYGMKFDVSPAPESGVTYTWVIENAGQKTGSSIQQDLAKDGIYNVTMVAKTAQGCECTVTKQVTMNRSQVKGLNEIGAAIYPNPTTGVINIALKAEFGKNVQVVMTTLAGAVVKNFNTVNNGLITFNADNLSSGMYMVKVVSGSNSAASKINIQH